MPDPGYAGNYLATSLSPVRLHRIPGEIAVTAGESDRVVMDERTGTIVVGGAVTCRKGRDQPWSV